MAESAQSPIPSGGDVDRGGTLVILSSVFGFISTTTTFTMLVRILGRGSDGSLLSELMICNEEDIDFITSVKNGSCLKCKRERESSASKPCQADSVKIYATDNYMLSQICGPSYQP